MAENYGGGGPYRSGVIKQLSGGGTYVERDGSVGGGPYRVAMKSRLGIGQVVPLYDGAGLEKLDKQSEKGGDDDPNDFDIDWNEYSSEPTHRHAGHPDEHAARIKHRKESADHLHGEEDKLVAEYKQLHAKAKQGACTPAEIQQLRKVKGQMYELNARRTKDARQVMFGAGVLKKAEDGPVQGGAASQWTSVGGVVHHQQRALS